MFESVKNLFLWEYHAFKARRLSKLFSNGLEIDEIKSEGELRKVQENLDALIYHGEKCRDLMPDNEERQGLLKKLEIVYQKRNEIPGRLYWLQPFDY